MRIFQFISFLAITIMLTLGIGMFSPKGFGQDYVKVKQVRILFLLDGSSSMTFPWMDKSGNNELKFDRAKEIIARVMDSVRVRNANVEFGLRVFGHQYPAQDKNCKDSKLEVDFSKGNELQINRRLRYISARGYSPIAWSLEQTALNDFVDTANYIYSLILITDGGESCGGDICATMQQLLGAKISFKPYILSLTDFADLSKEYNCLGDFLMVLNPEQEQSAIHKILKENEPLLQKGSVGLKEIPKFDYKNITPTVVDKTVTKTDTLKPVTPEVITETSHKFEPFKEPFTSAKVQKFDKVILRYVYTGNPFPYLPNNINFKREPIEETPATVVDYKQNKLQADSVKKSRIIMAYNNNPVKYIKNNLKIFDFPAEASPNNVAQKTGNQTVKENKPKPNVPKPTIAQKRTTFPKIDSTPVDVKVQVEPAKETMVNVYFIDQNGKIFSIDTKLDLLDPATKKVVSNIVVSNDKTTGKPIPIKMAPGNYVFKKSTTAFKSKPIEIKENMVNNVYLTITRGSIGFYYRNHPTKTIENRIAYVTHRFKNEKVTTQNCNEILPYDPGGYHIDFNTLPPSKAAFSYLEFNEILMIGIAENGTLEITNTNKLGNAIFYYPDGDRFLKFYEMNINGSLGDQKVEMLPGTYHVNFKNAQGQEQKIEFQIIENQTTKLNLQ